MVSPEGILNMFFLHPVAKKEKISGITLLLVVALLILFFLLYPREQSIDSLIQEIYALPMDTTIQTLEQDGYFNLTDVQPERIPDIHVFLQGDSMFRPTILKTVTVGTDGPLIRMFYRPEQSSIIYMTTYDVAHQAVYALNITYYTQTTEISKDNCVTEVWLEPHNGYEPYLLYCYYFK